MVTLAEVLSRNETTVAIEPDKQYQEVTVRLWGKGVTSRGFVNGSDIASKRRFQVSTGQFIVSRIDARNGAMGIVPSELATAIVTNDFPTFNVLEDRMSSEYFGWFSQTKGFVDLCRSASEGTTNRVRLKEERFLQLAIPLPPLDVQKSTVVRIDRLAEKIVELKALRRQSTNEMDQLCRAIIRDDRYGIPTPTLMSEMVSFRATDTEVDATESYDFAGVYCFGRGVFRGQRRTGTEFAYKRLTRIRAGEFIYPKLMAWEGALAVVPDDCDGLFVSPEFPVFTINTDKVLPEVIDVYFRSPAVWPLLSGASTGTNVRRKRLNPSDFLRYEFPLPSREAQFVLRNVRRKLTDLGAASNQTSQLEALPPSILDRAFKGEL